jgi:TM2 domain-containing membrane protein YozV
MKKAATAALWSIFVFPGSGHFVLKKPISGTVIVSLSLVALTVIVVKAVERAMLIVDKVISGEIPLDPLVIAEQVSIQSAQADSQLLSIATYGLIVVWIFAAIDAYRIGRIKDKDPG